jgi:hypothetical protein
MSNLIPVKSVTLASPRFGGADVASRIGGRSAQFARTTVLNFLIPKQTSKGLVKAELQRDAINRQVLLKVQHDRLVLAAQTFLSCYTCAVEVAGEACCHLECAHVNVGFESSFLLREVVSLSIARISQSSRASDEAFQCNRQNHDHGTELQAAALPWPERAVFLMRDVLRYSRRETALLLRMTDAQIEQLTGFARNRITSANTTSVASLKEWYRHKLFSDSQCLDR